MSEVKIVRLQTGEEIICKVLDSSKKDTKLLKKPAIIIPVGQGKIGLAPWMPYADIDSGGLEVKEKHIMFIIEPLVEFLNEYNTAFGSGLVVAGASTLPVGAADAPDLKLTK